MRKHFPFALACLGLVALVSMPCRGASVHERLENLAHDIVFRTAAPLAIVGPELLADLDRPASAVRAAANY